MKRLSTVIYLCTGFLAWPIVTEFNTISYQYFDVSSELFSIGEFGFSYGLTGRCTNNKMSFKYEGQGDVTVRQYFACNRLNIAISDLVYPSKEAPE